MRNEAPTVRGVERGPRAGVCRALLAISHAAVLGEGSLHVCEDASLPRGPRAALRLEGNDMTHAGLTPLGNAGPPVAPTSVPPDLVALGIRPALAGATRPDSVVLVDLIASHPDRRCAGSAASRSAPPCDRPAIAGDILAKTDRRPQLRGHRGEALHDPGAARAPRPLVRPPIAGQCRRPCRQGHGVGGKIKFPAQASYSRCCIAGYGDFGPCLWRAEPVEIGQAVFGKGLTGERATTCRWPSTMCHWLCLGRREQPKNKSRSPSAVTVVARPKQHAAISYCRGLISTAVSVEYRNGKPDGRRH
jgi:hypothetical protein